MTTPNVHILITCRNESLLRYSTLVFDSLRVGFPTAKIIATGNSLPLYALEPIKAACDLTGTELTLGSETIHHRWIKGLLEQNEEPFVICDTDQVMYDSMEVFDFSQTPLAGRRIPQFRDEFSGCITRSRLHTSLLYINPALVKERLSAFTTKVADTPFTPIANLIYPQVVPFNGEPVFYDTMAQLYHAIGGTKFSEDILDRYFHSNFGSIEDIVLPRLNGSGDAMKKARDWVLENPVRGRGAWRYQEGYYLARQT